MLIDSKLSIALRIISLFLFVFTLVQIFIPLKIRLFNSEWLFMYSCCIFGGILSFFGNINKDTNLVINKLGKIAMYGNLIIGVLFLPPVYFIWGTFLEFIITSLK